jgi:hypothetical protein
LVQVLGAQYRLESVGFGVDAALSAGASQQRPQLGLGQLRRRARGGSGGEDGAGRLDAAGRGVCRRRPR